MMLVRSKADPSIIGVVTPSTRTGIKLTRSSKPWSGEARVGCIFGYSERNWVACDDHETRAALAAFKASGIEPFHFRM